MTDPDRLAEIKARQAIHDGATLRTQGVRDIDWLVGEVERLDYLTLVAQRDLKRLRGLLARLEWADRLDESKPSCPACGEWRQDGIHEPDCWLAAELRWKG